MLTGGPLAEVKKTMVFLVKENSKVSKHCDYSILVIRDSMGAR